MAELENDVDVDNTDYEEVESYEDDTQENQNTSEQYSKSEIRVFRDLKIDPENASLEDFKKVAKILAKTQDRLMEHKNGSKKGETGEVMTEKDITLREEVADFLLENKDLKEYKSEILKYRKQGFTMKQSVALVENDDVTIENRRKTQSMNITSWEESGKTTYTYDELEKMTQSEYNKVKELQLKWKVTFRK